VHCAPNVFTSSYLSALCARRGLCCARECAGNDWGVRPNSFSLTLTHSPEKNKREEYYWEYGFIILRHLLLICVELRASFLMSWRPLHHNQITFIIHPESLRSNWIMLMAHTRTLWAMRIICTIPRGGVFALTGTSLTRHIWEFVCIEHDSRISRKPCLPTIINVVIILSLLFWFESRTPACSQFRAMILTFPFNASTFDHNSFCYSLKKR